MASTLLQGLFGALFGAVLSMVIFFWVGDVNWSYAYLIMGICFVLGAALGHRFLEWIRDLIRALW